MLNRPISKLNTYQVRVRSNELRYYSAEFYLAANSFEDVFNHVNNNKVKLNFEYENLEILEVNMVGIFAGVI